MSWVSEAISAIGADRALAGAGVATSFTALVFTALAYLRPPIQKKLIVAVSRAKEPSILYSQNEGVESKGAFIERSSFYILFHNASKFAIHDDDVRVVRLRIVDSGEFIGASVVDNDDDSVFSIDLKNNSVLVGFDYIAKGNSALIKVDAINSAGNSIELDIVDRRPILTKVLFGSIFWVYAYPLQYAYIFMFFAYLVSSLALPNIYGGRYAIGLVFQFDGHMIAIPLVLALIPPIVIFISTILTYRNILIRGHTKVMRLFLDKTNSLARIFTED
ncbi:MAG: hypothetical protein J0H11_14910 [Rhizobiales bacterium]|nr:hypothetical protein [Hyphomicrobiales bacterium]